MKWFTLMTFFLLTKSCQQLTQQTTTQEPTVQTDSYRVVSYNVENLFDTWNEDFKYDDDFTPQGNYYWGTKKYYKKINDIGKVLINVSADKMPAVIGLVEVENKRVLEDLVTKSPLQKFSYAVVHEESPDERGIDVALLFDETQFEYLDHQIGRIEFPDEPDDKTRDILFVKGKLGGELVYLAVNHWPSRRGGESVSAPKRFYVAQQLRQKADAILAKDPEAGIIIMGDFNDTPSDRSIYEFLGAKPWSDNSTYINLMYEDAKAGKGTYKFQNQWNMLDQFIISRNLTDQKGRLVIHKNSATIYDADWLKEDDPVYLGYRLNRTFLGPRYKGGYSDHFPILLDIYVQ